LASFAGSFNVTYNTAASTGALAATFGNLVAALTSCGLAQTSDTGQVTAGSIVNSLGNGFVNQGYQIWKFTDALAGSQPVYLKLEYCQQNSVPTFFLTVGSASNGTGGLTGTISPRMYFMGGGGTDSTPDASILQTAYISGDGANASGNARVALAFCEGPTRFPGCLFSVERSVDASGVDTNVGIIVHCLVGSYVGGINATPAPVMSMFIPYAGTLAGYQTGWVSALNHNNASLFFGSMVGFCQVVPFNFIPYKPGKNVALYYTSDFALYSTNTLSVNGSNHTYLALNQQVSASPTGGSTPYTAGVFNIGAYPASHILLRYE
jgi:hypothetical protein